MLHEVVEFAEATFPGLEPGFAPVVVKWRINLPKDDLGIWTILPFGEAGLMHLAAPEYPPNLMQGGGKCHFLLDEVRTTLLLLDKKDDRKKFEIKNRFFTQLLEQASPVHHGLGILAAQLRKVETRDALRQWLQSRGAASSDVALFVIDGVDLSREEPCRQWWREYRKNLLKSSRKGCGMICLLSGVEVTPARTHDKISGLKRFDGRGQDVVAGFDKPAFGSYGLDQSENAAMSEHMAKAYVQGLNHLVEHHCQDIGGAAVVYWFKEKVLPAEDLIAMLFGMQTEKRQAASALGQARKLLQAIRTGERAQLGHNHYYAMTLSGASGRVMVRDWMEGQFAQLLSSIEAWFSDLSIVHRESGEHLAPDPKFRDLGSALVREREDLPASTAAVLWRTAVAGQAIPQPLLAQALDRFRSALIRDETFNHARMGLIKAYFVRKPSGDQHMKPYLNPDHPDPAYHCGRLLAVLAKLQHSALGDVGAGVVQRFYPAASTAPGLTLGRLISNARNHLGKLDGGLSFWYEQQIGEVMGRFGDGLPRALDLEGQGLFALGYYQQLAALRSPKKNAQDDKHNGEQP
jgi:CRISPR-associated protein Csd1